jgi:NAD(P)-dependent dehydrogenase (short-subunit alcohol dehydrogenase family)
MDRRTLRETALMELSLDGKVALVTGASKGIGKAIAAAYAEAGAAVMLSARKQDQLDAAAEEIAASAPGARVAAFAANAGEPEQADACIDATIERFGALDILVNNAGTNPHFGPLIDIELAAWDKTFQVNLRGAFAWCQLAWRAWMRDHGGVILNMSSAGGLRYSPGLGAYDVTKAGLIHLTQVLAAELGPGVRVNALAPAVVKTDFARALWENREAQVAARTPLGRIGEPDDVAGAALFLVSDASSWITGVTMVLDGGSLAAGGIGAE